MMIIIVLFIIFYYHNFMKILIKYNNINTEKWNNKNVINLI